MSTSESVASTLTAPSEDEPSTDEEDNADDTADDDSGTDTAASGCSPAATPSVSNRIETQPSTEVKDKPDAKDDPAKVPTGEAPEDKGEVTAASLALLPGPDSLTSRERTLSASQGSLKSIPDNDSSATLSADEGPPTAPIPFQPPTGIKQPSGEGRGGGGGDHPGSSTPGAAPLPQGPPPPKDKPATPQPQDPKRKSPACVRDLIHSAIERNLQQPETEGGSRNSKYLLHPCTSLPVT